MRRTLTSIVAVVLLLFPISCGLKPTTGWTTFTNPNYMYDMLLVDDHVFWVAGPGGIAQYDIRSGKTMRYTQSDGLAGTFYRLRRAPDSSILAIGNRVYRFDGKSWRKEDILPTDPETWQIFDIRFASDGTPWMIGRNLRTGIAGDAIYRFDEKTWQKMLPGYPGLRLVLSPDGSTVWTASWRKIEYYQNDEWKELSYPFKLAMGISLYDFVVDAQGHPWFTIGGTGKSSTLYYFDGDQWRTIESEPGKSLGNIWTDPTDGIWYLIQNYGTPSGEVSLIHRVGTQVKEMFPLQFSDISIFSFNAFTRAADGSLWLGGDGANRWAVSGPPGLYHFEDGAWKRVLLETDIPYLSYGSCAVDNEGQVYFSSEGKVLRWDGHSWSVLDKPNSLYLSDLKEFDGQLWAHDRGVYRLDVEHWISVFNTPNNETISDYSLDSDGTLWIAGFNATNVWISHDGKTLDVPVKGTNVLDDIKSLDIDQHGNVYLATVHRLYRWDGANWQVIKDFGTEIQTFALINDQPWVAIYGRETVTEVYYLEGTEWKLVQNLNLDTRSNIREAITGIYSTNHGKVIWLTTGPGYPGQGVIRYDRDQRKSVRITIEDGLADNSVTAICEDHTGAIWFATLGGISRYVQ